MPENDNEFKGVDLDVLIIVDEQDEISRRLAQSRLVPVTDAEAELDLATLVYGHPERDYFESPLSRRFKSSDVWRSRFLREETNKSTENQVTLLSIRLTSPGSASGLNNNHIVTGGNEPLHVI